MRKLLLLLPLLAACSATPPSPEKVPTTTDASAAATQKEMCVEENVGLLRFSRNYLEEFCPTLKTQFELTCFRFVQATKEWRKACPGIDTADKLECI